MDFKRLRSRKGAALAEAALVYPAAILSLLLALAFAVLLFRQGCFSASVHMGLREAGGRATATVFEGKTLEFEDKLFETSGVEKECGELVRQRIALYCGSSGETVSVSCRRLAIFPRLKAETNREGKRLPLLDNPMGIHMEGELTLQDEAAFLRNKKLLTEGGS